MTRFILSEERAMSDKDLHEWASDVSERAGRKGDIKKSDRYSEIATSICKNYRGDKMRNPLNTEPEVKADIERLTSEMLGHVKDASDKTKSVLHYYICKNFYVRTITEIKEKNYKDIMIIDFPKPPVLILPEDECRIMDLIEKWKAAKTANLKVPYYKALKDICRRIK